MELVTNNTKHIEPVGDEFNGAAAISEFLMLEAARMPVDSKVRAFALRSATRWDRIKDGLEHGGLIDGGRPDGEV